MNIAKVIHSQLAEQGVLRVLGQQGYEMSEIMAKEALIVKLQRRREFRAIEIKYVHGVDLYDVTIYDGVGKTKYQHEEAYAEDLPNIIYIGMQLKELGFVPAKA